MSQIRTARGPHDRKSNYKHARDSWSPDCSAHLVGWKTSLRFLARHRTLSAIAITTTALAVGANTMIFSVVRAVFLWPLGFPNEQQLVEIRECNQAWHQANLKRGHSSADARGCITVSGALYGDFQTQATSYQSLGAGYSTSMLALTGGAEPVLLVGARVTPDMFRVLGVPPILGRWPDADFRVANDNREVLLGYALWKSRFAGNPGILGTKIDLAGNPHTVVGVMPPGFSFPDQTEIWLPHPYGTSGYASSYGGHNLTVIGRLKPGVGLAAAQAEAAAFSARAAAVEPLLAGWTSQVDTLRNEGTFAYRRGFIVLSAGVVIVLLIACANLSNLMLASLERRSSEMALRVALGARRKDLYLQILRESLTLSLAGGVLGLLLVFWGLDLLRPIIPPSIPRAGQVRADFSVALFSLAVSTVTGLLFALLPGLRASDARIGDALRPGFGRFTGFRGLRDSLVSMQVAFAIVLLSAAGLLGNTLRHLAEQELGFRRDHLLVAEIPMSSRTRYGDDAQRAAFVADLQSRLSREPGVQGVGIGHPLPFTGKQEGRLGVEVEGRPGVELGIVQFRKLQPRPVSDLGNSTTGRPLLR